MHYLNPLLAFITHHTGLAYGAIFLVSLSESLALVGLLVPGTVIMFGVGAVVAAGSLSLTPVLLLAMAGAVAGDGLSYWLGHNYKERLVNIWPFSRYPGMLKKGEVFFHRHGGKSVLFGRFVGPVRPVIPVVAGMLGMRPANFAFVNVLSAVGWALAYILPGVFFGASLAVAGAVSTRLAVLILILVVVIWSLFWLCRRMMSLFERRSPVWLASLNQWAAAGTSPQGAARPLKRLLAFLLVGQQGEEVLLAFLALVLLAAGWGFLGVLQDVLAKDPLVLADQAVYHFLQSLRTPWADQVLVAVTELGDALVNIFLAVAVLLVLLSKRCHRAAGFWALTALGGLLGVQLLKWAVHLPRPVAIYQGASAYGFPSGHATMSLVLYGFLALLLARKLSGAWQWGVFAGAVLISFLIGFSRLYLGAHWLSDVMGGYFMGASWTAMMGIAYLKRVDRPIPRRLLGVAVAVVLVIGGGWHIIQRHEKDLVFYAPRHDEKTIAFSAWQTAGWHDLPAWRIDMEGELEQPLTLQWAGSPAELARFLLTKGWQPPPALGLKSFFGIFSPNPPLEQLPVLPRLHDGRTERLRLVRMDPDRRLVLRLWSTGVQLEGSGTPLFVGTVEEQGRRGLGGLITLARDTGEYDRPLNLLAKTLGQGFGAIQVLRANRDLPSEPRRQRLSWQGEVLLSGQNPAS